LRVTRITKDELFLAALKSQMNTCSFELSGFLSLHLQLPGIMP